MPKHEFTEEGRNREEMMRLISDIFRVIARPVDKDSLRDLAPGEIGIDFNEWCIYARNPYTDEIITPNSLAHLKTILGKYDADRNILSADRIGNVRIYTDIKQLRQLQGLVLSVDSIVRQMEYPSIFISDMVSDNPNITQLPAESGILTVIKMSEDYVTIRFYDAETCSSHSGMYDVSQHLFTGWIVEKGAGSVTSGSFDYVNGNISGSINQDIGDLSIVTIRLKEPLLPDSLVDINNTGLDPVKTVYGEKLTKPIPENSIIMLIRDEVRKCWLYADSSQTALSVITEIATGRVSEVKTEIEELRKEVAELAKRPAVGKIDRHVYNYIVPSTGASDIIIPNFDHANDHLFVNIGQTLLRHGIDYAVHQDDSVSITSFNPEPGTLIQFVFLQFANTDSSAIINSGYSIIPIDGVSF